jgi:hypothetical protein
MADASDSWITVTAGGSGTGSGAVQYAVGPNAGPPRSGTVTVGGRAGATINQGCGFTLSHDSVEVSSRAADVFLSLSTDGPACAWSAASNVPWISLGALNGGRGSRGIHLQVAANPLTTARTGIVTVAGQTFTVVQAGCTVQAFPASMRVPPDLAQYWIEVVADNPVCAWTASSTEPWITLLAGASGSGTQRVPFAVSDNQSLAPRTGFLIVGGQTIAVTQDGACEFTLRPLSQEFGSAGGRGIVEIFTRGDCRWTAASNDPWIQITSRPSGTGAALVRYTVDPHTGSARRAGTMLIARQTFAVYQDGTGN